MNRKLVAAAIIAVTTAMVVTAYAQFGGQFGGGRQNGGFGGGGRNCIVGGAQFGSGEGDTSIPRDINRAGFVYARVRYHSHQWRGATNEVPWHHDYPDGDTMFPDNLGKLTMVTTDPNSYQIVDIDSKVFFQ
jgi:hypothetical protein